MLSPEESEQSVEYVEPTAIKEEPVEMCIEPLNLKSEERLSRNNELREESPGGKTRDPLFVPQWGKSSVAIHIIGLCCSK